MPTSVPMSACNPCARRPQHRGRAPALAHWRPPRPRVIKGRCSPSDLPLILGSSDARARRIAWSIADHLHSEPLDRALRSVIASFRSTPLRNAAGRRGRHILSRRECAWRSGIRLGRAPYRQSSSSSWLVWQCSWRQIRLCLLTLCRPRHRPPSSLPGERSSTSGPSLGMFGSRARLGTRHLVTTSSASCRRWAWSPRSSRPGPASQSRCKPVSGGQTRPSWTWRTSWPGWTGLILRMP